MSNPTMLLKTLFICLVIAFLFSYCQTRTFAITENPQEKELISIVNAGDMEKLKAFYMEYPDAMISAVGNTWLPHIIVSSSISAIKQIEFLQYFVERGGDLDSQNIDGDTPLMIALSQGSLNEKAVQVAVFLIEQKSSLTVQGQNGQTAMHLVAATTDEETHQLTLSNLMIQKSPEPINMQDAAGKTPLQYAVKAGNEQMVRWLLENGADPSIKDKSEDTATDLAAFLAKASESKSDSLMRGNINKLIESKK